MSVNSTKALVDHDVEMFRKYKDLLAELTRKNVKLKYRNSWLGILWSFFQPLLNMVVLAVVFGALFGKSNEHTICFPVYLFTGRLIYDFFNTATKQSMISFRKNAAIIKKVYVPKYMYPLSSILSTFVNFAISIICYVCVWIFFKVTKLSGGADLHLSWRIFLVFIPMLLILMFSVGIGLILSVVCVYFRDIEYIWDVGCRLLLYMVPILYPFQNITTPWIRTVIKINPLYTMIELFRHCVLYGNNVVSKAHPILSPELLLYATGCSIAALVLGILVFNKYSDNIVYHL